MRIPRERVAALARAVVDTLIQDGIISLGGKKEPVVTQIEVVILDDLQIEDRLNAEVKALLVQYEREMAQGAIDYQTMFQRVKKQLIKERDLTL